MISNLFLFFYCGRALFQIREAKKGGEGNGYPRPDLPETYSTIPANRNCEIETAVWISASFFLCALETRWLGTVVSKITGLFFRN